MKFKDPETTITKLIAKYEILVNAKQTLSYNTSGLHANVLLYIIIIK